MLSDSDYSVRGFPLELPFGLSPIISLLANSIVVASFISPKKFENPLSSMVFGVNFMDMLFSIPKILSNAVLPSSAEYCSTFQMFSQYGLQSSILWSAFFGHAFWLFSKEYKFDTVVRMKKYHLLISMLVPIPIAILSFFYPYSKYAPDSGKDFGRCYLTVKRHVFIGNISYLAFFVAPILVSTTLSIIFYVMAAHNLKRFIREKETNHLLTLIIYPGIVIICWMPIVILMTSIILGLDPSDYVFLSLQFVAHLQGFFEAIVYSQSKLWLRKTWDRLCCCRAAQTERSSESQGLLSTSSVDKSSSTTTLLDLERHKSELCVI